MDLLAGGTFAAGHIGATKRIQRYAPLCVVNIILSDSLQVLARFYVDLVICRYRFAKLRIEMLCTDKQAVYYQPKRLEPHRCSMSSSWAAKQPMSAMFYSRCRKGSVRWCAQSSDVIVVAKDDLLHSHFLA